MKIKFAIPLLALGIVLTATTSRAQTTPTGTATSTTYPQGAVAPDSTTGSKSGRSQKRARRSQNIRGNATGSTSTTTGSQDDRYRGSSSSNGASINNTNSTNYNSNNVTTAPTGVGSSSSASGATAPAGSSATPAKPDDQASTGVSPSGTGVSTSTAGTVNATKAAVTGAQTTETPAVAAGSTKRNTSIGDFLSSSPNYTTLQNALQSADLFETLKGSGPYTVFAPSNSAFKKLPATVQGGLLEGRNRDALKQLLSYHVVSGSVDAGELSRQIRAGSGKAELKTLAESILTAQTEPNGRITLTDEQGATSYVETADMYQANGVVHGISAVLAPKATTATIR